VGCHRGSGPDFQCVLHNVKAQGTGYGLSISRSIVESHGGPLVALLATLRAGASFTISLPNQVEAHELTAGRRLPRYFGLRTRKI